MSVDLVAAFWGVSMLFVLTPGADWAYSIAAGLRPGSVVPAVGGLLLGHVVATVAVAAGVAAALAAAPGVLTAITVAGACYLIWLGARALSSSSAPLAAAAGGGSGSSVRQVAVGFGVSGLNPKVFLLFLALLPQFTSAAGPWPVPTQILVLGAVHVLNCAAVYLAVSVGARAVLASRPAAARLVTTVSGIAMIAIGLLLLVEQARS